MIRHGFDGGEELLKPTLTTQPVESFPKTVLVTFQRKVVAALQRRLPVEVVSTINACVEVPIYRETPGKVAERRTEGCGVVEMECASVMAAGQFRGKRSISFCIPRTVLRESMGSRALGSAPGVRL